MKSENEEPREDPNEELIREAYPKLEGIKDQLIEVWDSLLDASNSAETVKAQLLTFMQRVQQTLLRRTFGAKLVFAESYCGFPFFYLGKPGNGNHVHDLTYLEILRDGKWIRCRFRWERVPISPAYLEDQEYDVDKVPQIEFKDGTRIPLLDDMVFRCSHVPWSKDPEIRYAGDPSLKYDFEKWVD